MADMLSIESILIALLLGSGLALVSIISRHRHRRARRLFAIALAFAASAGVVWTAASLRQVPTPEAEIPFRPIAVPAGGFVTSDVCQSCHPREYASWHRSYHRTMTQLATTETMLGDFGQPTEIGDDTAYQELELDGRIFRIGQEGDTHWTAFEEEVDGEKRWVRRPILMMTGSHHVQAYWYPTGNARKMALLPFVHLVGEDRWIPRRSVFILPPPTGDNDSPQPYSAGERWNHTCIHCHTTDGRPHYQTLDSQVSEFGIACESCHGPAEAHVKANQSPLRRYGQHLGGTSDPTIVQPVDLGHQRSSMVCGICHGITYPQGDEVYQDLSTGRRFRPGDDLEANRRLVQPSRGIETLVGLPEHGKAAREQAFWSDGMVRVKGREYNGLVDSPCYQQGTLSCFSCHAMHQPAGDERSLDAWADDQLKPGMRGNAACVQCHTDLAGDGALAAHTRHPPQSSGSNCYNCHMPFTTYGLLKAIRSHQVDSPSVDASKRTGRPNACNNCHLDKSFGWAADHLQAGWNVQPPAISEVERAVPASLLFLLSGDASQRALTAWHMAWDDARQVSGTHWMTPFLAQTLLDPYEAVRYNATVALRRQAGFGDLAVDYLASEEERRRVARQIAERYRGLTPPPGEIANPHDLLAGDMPADIFRRLLAIRDESVTALAE